MQLVSYIAPAAPATRRPATGTEPFLRPEIGFTPAWFRQHADIDFGARFHTDPDTRRRGVAAMRSVLRKRFPGTAIGGIDRPDAPPDLLTGTFGACTVAALFGVPVVHAADRWPTCVPAGLTDRQLARLEPPDLDRSPHFARLMEQLDRIERGEGRVEGFINWQGVLNNAHRLRGEALFLDLLEEPEKARHLFACVTETMIRAAARVHRRQRRSGVDVRFLTVSNCLVNLVSPRVYQNLLLPFDRRLAAVHGCLGVHNCAWNATPYLGHYAAIPGVAYLDMGLATDLPRARRLFPDARRAVMYTPMALANKPPAAIRADLARIAQDLGPCDLVCADIDAGTPDERVHLLLNACREISAAPPPPPHR